MEMVLWKTMQTVSLVPGIGIYNTTAEDMYILYAPAGKWSQNI
jgi:hypothetical protein